MQRFVNERLLPAAPTNEVEQDCKQQLPALNGICISYMLSMCQHSRSFGWRYISETRILRPQVREALLLPESSKGRISGIDSSMLGLFDFRMLALCGVHYDEARHLVLQCCCHSHCHNMSGIVLVPCRSPSHFLCLLVLLSGDEERSGMIWGMLSEFCLR